MFSTENGGDETEVDNNRAFQGSKVEVELLRLKAERRLGNGLSLG